MFSSRWTLSGCVHVVAYAACSVLLTWLVGWSVLQVSGTLAQMVDAMILDGSGRATDAPESPGKGLPAVAASEALTTAGAAEPAKDAAAAASPAARQSGSPAIVPSRISTDIPEDDPVVRFHNGASDTHRTYCVRLCDGYFWPISFSTTAEHFDRDQAACAAACGSPARLFVHKVPFGGPGTMVSLEGLPYTALKTAFRFRANYDAQCTCKPQPWEQQAQDRHRLYAATEAARKGSKSAAAEARLLTAKLEAMVREDNARLAAANIEASRELTQLGRKMGLDPSQAQAVRQSARERDQAAKLARIAAERDRSMMRLGAVSDGEPPPSKSGFRPASGNNRYWKDRVFTDQ